ncbi:MAG: cysteine hydrolase [Acetobacteraceae bacterium]|jgi:ureidoacrylate peracid hydrolase
MAAPSRTVAIAARPASLEIDLGRSAVLVIDMQNDFGSPGGMFDRIGIDLSVIRQAVPPTQRVVAAARAAGIPIVYLKMAHRPDLSDTGGQDSPHWFRHEPMAVGEAVTAPDGQPSRILIEGTWNTDVLPELAPHPGDIVVSKHRYSGFFETDLDDQLCALGARNLIVTGCTTSVCVESTIRDAMFRDYVCLLLEDCTGQPPFPNAPFGTHEASLLTIQAMFGWVSDSASLIAAL